MKLLLYCTKAKPYLRKLDNYFLDKHNVKFYWAKGQTTAYRLNGKIVAECDFEVEKLFIKYGEGWQTETIKGTENIEKLSCIDRRTLYEYCKGKGYAIHIKNLHIFDNPKELSDYYKYIDKPIINAPQNMMKAFSIKEYSRRYVENGYVYEVRGDDITDYVLISIRPEWLCKILNGEKTIEIRKKVLKEMLK